MSRTSFRFLSPLARSARRTRVAALLACSILALSAQTVIAQSVTPAAAAVADSIGVRDALSAYIEGHRTGKAEAFQRAFHPDASMYQVREGQLVITPIRDYIARAAASTPAPESANYPRTIERIEVRGVAATGRILLDYPTGRITDYMTLLKVGSEWRIVSKAFHVERRAPTEGAR